MHAVTAKQRHAGHWLLGDAMSTCCKAGEYYQLVSLPNLFDGGWMAADLGVLSSDGAAEPA